MLGKVLVVEDDDFTRVALKSALQLAGVQTIEARTAADALKQAESNIVSVALLDLHLGEGPNGIDLAQELRRRNHSIGLVFLSSFSSPRLLMPRAKLPTGSIYLNKRSLRDTDSLLRAINKSLKQNEAINQSPVSAISSLSTSQLETIQLVAQGLSNSEIAKRRFVTEKSVEKTLSRVAKALGLNPSAETNQRVKIASAFLEETGNQQTWKE